MRSKEREEEEIVMEYPHTRYTSCSECPHKIRCGLIDCTLPDEKPYMMYMSTMMCYEHYELPTKEELLRRGLCH